MGSEMCIRDRYGAGHNVYSKDTDGSPGNQGTVDTAQIAWDFLSKYSKDSDSEI